MLKGEGRFTNRPTKTGGKTYDKFFLYVPTGVAKDSAFPFEESDKVTVKIDPEKKRIIVTRD